MRHPVFLALVALLLLRVFATFFPTSWLWGLDSLADAPSAVRWIGLALFAAALLPRIWAPLLPLGTRIGRIAPPLLWIGLGLFLAVLLLWLGRIEHNLLGDAQTWISSLERGVRAAGGAHREPLPQAVLAAVYGLTGGHIGGAGTFTLLGLFLGAAYLLLGGLLARHLAADGPGRVLAFSCLVLGGGPQIFSGYAEFYGFVVAAGLLFAWLGLRFIEGRSGLIPVALAYVLAGLCHAQMIFAGPALLVLALISWKSGRRRETIVSLALVPIATVLALLVLRYPFSEIGKQASQSDSFLPPLGGWAGRPAYAAYALPHLAELVNVLLLVSPGLLIALALRPGESARDQGDARFLGALAAGPALFALFANPALGMIRDWDIFLLAATFGALWAISRAVRSRERNLPVGLVGAVALTCLLHAGCWILSNHQSAWALERVRRVAANPAFFGEKTHGEIWRYVGSADVAAGQPQRASDSYFRSIVADPDGRMTYRMLAGIEIARAGSNVEEGLARYTRLLAGTPSRSVHVHIGACFAALLAHREDVSLVEASKAVGDEPRNPEILAVFGDFLRRAGREAEARGVYGKALSYDPHQVRALTGLACLAGMRGERPEAERLARLALSGMPWSPQAQQFLELLARPTALSPEEWRAHLYIR
jgi:tetratricopeptide (TPR) repeat protein